MDDGLKCIQVTSCIYRRIVVLFDRMIIMTYSFLIHPHTTLNCRSRLLNQPRCQIAQLLTFEIPPARASTCSGRVYQTPWTTYLDSKAHSNIPQGTTRARLILLHPPSIPNPKTRKQ